MNTAGVSSPIREAKLNLKQPIFQENRVAWHKILEKFAEATQKANDEGDDFSQQRHIDRSQLLARDRVALLLDPDSPFLELCVLAGHGMDPTPCASIVAGIGKVSGRACMILASIPTLKGGSWNEFTVLKHNRATEIATQNKLPVISLVQSAGAYLPQQFKVFHRAGQMFRDLARRSQENIPSCALVFGSSTAGGAYIPGLSDYTVFVQNQAQVFLGGPPLVKMAIGEQIDAESLGGAKMHGTVTGLADRIAIDEFDAIRSAREWVTSLDNRSTIFRPLKQPRAPRFPAEDLLAIVNPDIRKPFDMNEVVLRLVDDSHISPFKPSYGKNLLTGRAEIHGHSVGIIANQTPVIHPDEASKGAQFIRLCNQNNIPIIYLHNVTGFMVGSKAEREAIIKKGAQLVSAVACSKVPQISVILGSSYGAGNYAMCGRAYEPRFLFTWPSGRCSVMGPDQLAGVMNIVQTVSAERKNQIRIPDTGQAKVFRDQTNDGKPSPSDAVEKTRQMVEQQSESYYTSANLLDDGIIDPRDTRDVLGVCLDVVRESNSTGAVVHRGVARL